MDYKYSSLQQSVVEATVSCSAAQFESCIGFMQQTEPRGQVIVMVFIIGGAGDEDDDVEVTAATSSH